MRALEAAFLIGVEGATEVLLVRHGDCYDGLTDPTDPPLSELGRRQAGRLGERLRRLGVDAVYSSNFRRAIETAHAISDEVTVDPRLREIEQDPIAAAEAALNRYIHFTESPEDVQDRVRAAVDEAIEAHPGGRIAIVSHGGAILAHLSEVLRLEFGRLRILPYYTSISVVRVLDGRRMPGALGDVAHLEAM